MMYYDHNEGNFSPFYRRWCTYWLIVSEGALFMLPT
jgi:hypothetical protein